MSTITPIGRRILIEKVEPENKTAGGIYLPDSASKDKQEAIVLALGTGGRDKDGNPIEFSVKVNDKVIVSKYGGTAITRDGKELVILHEDDVLAIIND